MPQKKLKNSLGKITIFWVYMYILSYTFYLQREINVYLYIFSNTFNIKQQQWQQWQQSQLPSLLQCFVLTRVFWNGQMIFENPHQVFTNLLDTAIKLYTWSNDKPKIWVWNWNNYLFLNYRPILCFLCKEQLNNKPCHPETGNQGTSKCYYSYKLM